MAIETEFNLVEKHAKISVALLFAPLTYPNYNSGRLSLRPFT